jgi:ABC transporter, permease protein
MLLSMMLPFQIIMIPQYILFNKLGWVGTYLPLIVPYFFGQGFFIFLNIQFIKGIPSDLDEAARMDGCSIYGIFFRIILPLLKPPLVTTAIFSFMWRWDEFLAPLIYLSNPQKYPVSYALKMFSDPTSGSDWGAMFAMATLSLIPIFIIFISLQKYLVEGIASTGIKS